MNKYIIFFLCCWMPYISWAQPCTINIDFENEQPNSNLVFNNPISYTNPVSNWRVNPGGVVFDFAQEASGNIFLVANDRGGAPSYISNVVDFTGDLLPDSTCGATFCFDVKYLIANTNPNNFLKTIYFFAPDNGPAVYTPATSVARFSFFTPIAVNATTWTNVCIPIEECTSTTLPSNTQGQWEWVGTTNQANTCTDWNNLIGNLAGIGFNTDISNAAGQSIPGEVWGFDNFCFTEQPCPVKECCQTELDISAAPVTPVHSTSVQGVPLTTANQTFTIGTTATIPITEIRVAVADVVFDYNYEQCGQCVDNPALWGSIETPTAQVGTTPQSLQKVGLPYYSSNLVGGRGNLREVIWDNPAGVMLQSGDTFEISYWMPPLSEIPCCVTKVIICLEISWKDANCQVCTKELTCTTMLLQENGN